MSNDTPRRLRSVRIGVAAAVAAGIVAVGGAMAWAMTADDGPPAGATTTASDSTTSGPTGGSTTTTGEHDHGGATTPDGARRREHGEDGEDGEGQGHRHAHEHLPPYDERYAEAGDRERRAADDLLDDVRGTLAGYADPDAAVAAGYRPGRHADGPIVHYANRQVARDGHVLDPSRPNGLVYYTPPEGDPVLLGAFFVVVPGTPAPTPAGDLLVWHSHDPSCASFFVEDGRHDCLDTRRMVHVWTADQVEVTSRRTGEPVDVRVMDPFGAPFRASVERVG